MIPREILQKIRRNSLSPALMATAAILVLAETFYFALQRPNYSHITNTISELGESGAPHERLVAFSFFLPVGLLVWLSLWLVCREASDKYAAFALVAIACLGAGYVVAAFFPCDPGAPLFGTWRTQIHNVAGFIDYDGTGIGFLLFSRYLAKQKSAVQAVAFFVAGVLVLVGLVFLSLEATFHVRGVIQRVTEVIQFTGVFFVCYLLSRQMTPNHANK